MGVGVKERPFRFDVFLVSFDPAVGSEIRKTRPCLIISPDEMNRYIRTLIVIPMTTATKGYPSRVPFTFQGKRCEAALDQIRTINKTRLIKRLGKVQPKTQVAIIDKLHEMFSL